MVLDSNRVIVNLTSSQGAGFNCVVCDISYVRSPVPHRPVGRSMAGSQVFACISPCAAAIGEGTATADLSELSAFTCAVVQVLRTERKRQSRTVAEIAERLEVTAATVCRWEMGTRPLDLARLARWCAVLGMSPAWVLAQAQVEAFPLGWPYHRDHVDTN